MATANKTRTKLTVRLWERLFNLLGERTEAICLRRDTLLEQVIANEINHLESDLPKPNSSAARAHIEHHFKLLLKSGSRQISLAMSPDIAKQLEAVCTEKNVPREAFLNRVILLLVAQPAFIDDALFELNSADAHQIRTDIKHEYSLNMELANGFAPLPMIADILVDPFWGYRAMMEKISKGTDDKHTLYGKSFMRDDLIGLNCYLPDECVPGTNANLEAQNRARALFAQLGGVNR